VEGAYLSQPQKAHLTDEFVVVMKNGGQVLLCLGSMLVTVVSEAVRQNFKFQQFLKISISGYQ